MRQDRITDEVRVTLYTEAISHNAPLIYDAPRLVVRCGSDERVEAFVHWGGQYVAGYDDKMEVAIRFDAHPAAFESWRESAGNEGAFMPFPITFIYRANQSEVVYVQMTDFSGDEFTAEFKLSGLADAMAAHPELCGMPQVKKGVEDLVMSDSVTLHFRLFTVSPIEYEPLFGIGVPQLQFHCTGEKSIYLRIEASGEVFGKGETTYGELTASSVRFDNGSLENVMWDPSLSGYSLESPVLSVFNQAKNSDTLILSGTMGSSYEVRAEYDISELGELIRSEPKCTD